MMNKQIALGAAGLLALGGVGYGIGTVMTTSSPKASTLSGAAALTGKSGSCKLLAVKIDNVVPARPATGLNHAAIVYAIQVEGGLSRLMPVYCDPPDVVGPVRSARESDLRILAQYNRPGFSYSGAVTRFLPILHNSPIIKDNGGAGTFRDGSRAAPHNEYLHTAGKGGGEAKDIGLRFGKAPPGGVLNNTSVISMPAARFGFTWNGSRYQVYMDRQATRWTADNVIIQHVHVGVSPHHFRDDGHALTPYTETVGHGTGIVLRDGHSYSITWSRGSEKSGTNFKLNGHTMNLHPGRTWIVLA